MGSINWARDHIGIISVQTISISDITGLDTPDWPRRMFYCLIIISIIGL